MANYPFEAWYESGTIVSFEAPQTWRNVFSSFKRIARTEGRGELYCNGLLIRFTGRNDDVDYSSMEEDWALESQRRLMEADCCMCDAEASALLSEPFFDPWGDFEWWDNYGF